ncbi:peptidoglycan DD-metalloendopeptidase family protein [Clostridia bacterium]|nr:peptidoglycan DD-metalloendopeptidase family protein [Clostridia bacterium]
MKPFAEFRITSPYGPRIHPITKKQSFHTGIDLVVGPHKSPIKAFVPGTVVHAKMAESGTGLGGYGIVVAIVDSFGALHMYAHLNSVDVKKGDNVNEFQIIGRQGTTGISTGSHCHYEVRLKSSPSFGWGTHTNPGKYLEELEAKHMSKHFKDLPEDHWGAAEAEYLNSLGMLNPNNAGNLRPFDTITRIETVALIARAVRLLSKKGE